MDQLNCCLIGAPVDVGAGVRGCVMGPDAFRTAGIKTAIEELGHTVADKGNIEARPADAGEHTNPAIQHLNEIVGWAEALQARAFDAAKSYDLPIFLGGDHSLSLGTVPGVTRYAEECGRPQFVLWLDAHSDIHTLDSTKSGNLHGVPVAYFVGREGFSEAFPPLTAKVPPENVCMIGIRSVDPAEKRWIEASPVTVHDMRHIDETGVCKPLAAFLDRVASAGGALHVSFDVDFLEPEIAPAVGTTVPGGATLREAHLIMEMLSDSALVTSLDLVELNPFLDERGRTATLMVDLCASLLGRRVFDRAPRRF